MTLRRLAIVAALAALPGAAGAVGLGPLHASGFTDGPGKAFYLTLINPYPQAELFRSRAIGIADEETASRVIIFPSTAVVGGNGNRRLLIIVKPLAPGETYSFRVCAARDPKPQESIYARVCSTLVARRLAARA